MECMRLRFPLLLTLMAMPVALAAQSPSSLPPYELSAGFAYFSNSFNGVPGAHNSMMGGQAAVGFPAWHNIRFKFDVSGFTGTNLGASQAGYTILGGGEYEHSLGRERVFGQALFGETGLNRYWGPNGLPGSTASFTVLLGGGVDTPVSKHFAVRVEADVEHTNFYLVQSVKIPIPYRIPDMPNFFGRYSAGLVWTPRLASSNFVSGPASVYNREPVESELTFESSNSFGHYHVFGVTWWSYLNVAGVEYDRHSWGKAIGAQVDYVAEILPVVVLRQPSKTDIWGNKASSQFTTFPGLGISPIGVRLLWRDGKRWKPYYLVKGGLIGFTHKSLSNYASYEDFTLQQSAGIQFKLTDRWDLRTAASDFHFSNGFVVPNNPGIDEMMYTVGLTRHFGQRQSSN
jgi:hypothetical protein